MKVFIYNMYCFNWSISRIMKALRHYVNSSVKVFIYNRYCFNWPISHVMKV